MNVSKKNERSSTNHRQLNDDHVPLLLALTSTLPSLVRVVIHRQVTADAVRPRELLGGGSLFDTAPRTERW
jgi:hypothetical protein